MCTCGETKGTLETKWVPHIVCHMRKKCDVLIFMGGTHSVIFPLLVTHLKKTVRT